MIRKCDAKNHQTVNLFQDKNEIFMKSAVILDAVTTGGTSFLSCRVATKCMQQILFTSGLMNSHFMKYGGNSNSIPGARI
jgi:hypothetical protein